MTKLSISALKALIQPEDIRIRLQYAFKEFSDSDIEELLNTIISKWQEVGIKNLDFVKGHISFNDHMMNIIIKNMDNYYFSPETLKLNGMTSLYDIEEALIQNIKESIVVSYFSVISETLLDAYHIRSFILSDGFDGFEE